MSALLALAVVSATVIDADATTTTASTPVKHIRRSKKHQRASSADATAKMSLNQFLESHKSHEDGSLARDMVTLNPEVDLTQLGHRVGDIDTTPTTSQFLTISVKSSTCATELHRVNYRLGFCVVTHAANGGYSGSFKFAYTVASDGSYHLVQYYYNSYNCLGTAASTAVSRYGVSTSTCGNLYYDSSVAEMGTMGYYYSFAYYDSATGPAATGATSLTTSFKYIATLQTVTTSSSMNLNNPSTGMIIK